METLSGIRFKKRKATVSEWFTYKKNNFNDNNYSIPILLDEISYDINYKDFIIKFNKSEDYYNRKSDLINDSLIRIFRYLLKLQNTTIYENLKKEYIKYNLNEEHICVKYTKNITMYYIPLSLIYKVFKNYFKEFKTGNIILKDSFYTYKDQFKEYYIVRIPTSDGEWKSEYSQSTIHGEYLISLTLVTTNKNYKNEKYINDSCIAFSYKYFINA